MRSKASINGHPIHPMLIPFPVAFIGGAVVFDLLALLFDSSPLFATGGHLLIGGVLTGLAAAVPGIIDYRYTVPPRSSGKRRAVVHAAFNVSALTFALISWLLRPETLQLEAMPAVLELLAAAAIMCGGYLGGTLAYRNQIGVDHRYAEAGKWKEITIDSVGAEPVQVAEEGELAINQMKLVRLGDRRIVLGRTAEGYVAFDDSCTHRGGSLAGGHLCEATVQCPWHGSQFDVHTGSVKAGPAQRAIGVYSVMLRDGKILLDPRAAANRDEPARQRVNM